MLAGGSREVSPWQPQTAPQNTAHDTVSPTVMEALTPVGVLISLLSFSVYLFGEDSSYGPNQIALCAVPPSLVCWDGGMGKPGRNSKPA